MSITRFNIRVYGLLVHAGSVLVSDELIKGKPITKFPGGGMQPGEGTLDCLKREVREEMGVDAFGLVHFYTTDFFQPSAYAAGDQIVSIYYRFRIAEAELERMAGPAQGHAADPGQCFRWLSLADGTPDAVDLPIDRVVLQLLLEEQAHKRRVGGKSAE
jgi:8-oxo-dGTP pyrophosphatase MutT (NUDIX family)